ncbi:unnamed protein product [Blepharisma stoltei]|uniref:GRIP domain-containing protein n=1 Tax=Blepharisma stoltei TaxID=1481888 RepID=A0AAU9JAA5_9CILI|nr:unnamed protein product [Blepharisma stoltei]
MWKNFKSIATEAIEAARDIREHIVDVTSGDVISEPPITVEEEHVADTDIENPYKFRAIHAEQQLEKALLEKSKFIKQHEDLKKAFEEEKSLWESEKQSLTEIICSQDIALSSKDREMEWQSQHYESQIQELTRAKNKAFRELESSSSTNASIEKLVEEKSKLKEKIDLYEDTIAKLKKTNDDLRNDVSDLKLKWEDEKKLDDDRISRAFFIQFLSSFNRNIGDFQARKDMLASLVGILQLTNEEKEMLGIENKSKQKIPIESTERFDTDFSLLDKFTSFLSGKQ